MYRLNLQQLKFLLTGLKSNIEDGEPIQGRNKKPTPLSARTQQNRILHGNLVNYADRRRGYDVKVEAVRY